MRSTFRVLGALAVAGALSIIGLTFAAWAQTPEEQLAQAALAVIAAPNSWLAWGGLVVLVASIITNVTPTPARDSIWFWPYKLLVELPALVGPLTKRVGTSRTGLSVIAILVVGIGLSGCAAVGGAAGGAAVVAVATEANEIAGATEATVCRMYGVYWAGKTTFGFKTPNTLEGVEGQVATFCAGDPVVGSTPVATLRNLAVLAMRLVAAQAPPRA